jgi:hypothetical protein|tara:strand:- start:19802 stop:20017 length:216 start_codon:yes stop_codon:yes gene_type:complete
MAVVTRPRVERTKIMSSFDALGPSDATSVRVKIRVHPSGEHYVRVPKTVREAIARREGEMKEWARSSILRR